MSVADRGELTAFLGVSDLDAAQEFYGDVLGLELRDDRGIWSAPDGTRIAWFLDPDRNNLSLHELTPERR